MDADDAHRKKILQNSQYSDAGIVICSVPFTFDELNTIVADQHRSKKNKGGISGKRKVTKK